MQRRTKCKNHPFLLGERPGCLGTFLPHWHEAAYRGEILICGEFLTLRSLLSCLGAGDMEKAPAHSSAGRAASVSFDPRPARLRGRRNRGQEARPPGCPGPAYQLPSLRLVMSDVWPSFPSAEVLSRMEASSVAQGQEAKQPHCSSSAPGAPSRSPPAPAAPLTPVRGLSLTPHTILERGRTPVILGFSNVNKPQQTLIPLPSFF